MPLQREFLELQARFARRAAAVQGIAEEEAFRLYTIFYGIVCDSDAGSPPARWNFDPEHVVWRGFVDAIRCGVDPLDHVDRAFRDVESRSMAVTRPRCFEYDYWPQDRLIRLHFGNSPDGSGLQARSMPARHRELHDLFTQVAGSHPEATAVLGTSCLYHLHAYRRLFPGRYVERLESAGHLHQFIALWGQFLDRHGRVKAALAEPFLRRVDRATDMSQLNDAFPFDVLRATCPIGCFYRHYEVSTAPARQ